MADDLISRQAMLDGIDKLIKIHFDRTVVLYKARKVAEDLPSAQPERKTGRWIWQKRSYTFDGEKCEILVKVCSYCGKPPIAGAESPYCPHCGEKKEGEWNDT